MLSDYDDIENENELKTELEKLTKNIISAYIWKKQNPITRFIDTDDMVRDFKSIVNSAFSH